MDEITSAVAVPVTLGNLIQKETVELTGLKLMANTAAALILNPATEGSQSFSVACEDDIRVSPQHPITVSAEFKEIQIGADLVSEMVIEGQSNKHHAESHNQAINEDESVVSEKSSTCREESTILRTNCYEMSSPNTIKVDDKIHGESSLAETRAELEPVQNLVSVAVELDTEDGSGSDGSDPKPFVAVHEMPEKQPCRTSCQNALELSGTPLWGFSSVCGRRQEMEDAVAVKPQIFEVPSWMLMDKHVNETDEYTSLAHFFGVYDGHGGSQVANYCQEHLHSVLIEEIKAAESSLAEENGRDNLQEQWNKAFSNCFHKVDDEIGRVHSGNGGRNIDDGSESSMEEPLTPETVGSTAVVAILTQTHIIVANCGDSRAVLRRGKEALPLSTDHKPNREDEWARIEAAGGRIIQWNGYRVLGVLAVSRSIGDRYLKPWIIPDPEVKCLLREKNDECLILASDGLWDVMTNEEACDMARKRILLWHKKNGDNMSREQGQGVDPAAQSAADYLSRLAIQRGSKDNISVIVIDLKAQRQFKRKA